MHTEIDVDVPTQTAGASVLDRTAPHAVANTTSHGADSGRLTVTEADVLALVDPVAPVAPVDVFFTPPTGVPVAEWPATAEAGRAAAPPVGPVVGPAAGPSRRERRRTRRRTRLVVLALGVVWAVALVGVVAYAVGRDEGDRSAVPPAAASPDPAPTADDTTADDTTADDGAADGAVAGDATADDGGVDAAAAGGASDAQQAVRSYIATRGTDAERAFSSQGGRDELDAVIADLGRAVPQGDATCTAVGVASFTCVQDTDQGAITFTVGPDPDDPATSGFEVVGAQVG